VIESDVVGVTMYFQVGHLDIYTDTHSCLSICNTLTFFIGMLTLAVVTLISF
jgi:hypothetical protein